MKILLLGGNGMLGSDCLKVLRHENEVIAPDKKDLDIISWDIVIDKLQRTQPDVILNCAGITDVDACETEAFAVRKINIEGPRNLAQGSARFNCRFIHISSDYVFDGKKGVPQPYFEDDPTVPISAYGKSKMESEVAARENAPNYIIIRTGWLYGINSNNFIHAILKKGLANKNEVIKVVNDQFVSPTWTYRFALQIKELLKNDYKATFHATSEGYCTPFELATYILKKLDIQANIEPCSLDDYVQKAKRPKNCILENRLLKKMGLNVMPDWKIDVDSYLDQFGESLIRKMKK